MLDATATGWNAFVSSTSSAAPGKCDGLLEQATLDELEQLQAERIRAAGLLKEALQDACAGGHRAADESPLLVVPELLAVAGEELLLGPRPAVLGLE